MSDEEKFERENGLVAFYRNNKILVWVLILIVIIIAIMKFVTFGNSNKDSDIKVVIEPNTNLSVGVGNTINLNAKVNTINAVIIWTSSDTNIARVSNGNVTGVNYGKALITAAYYDTDGSKYVDSVEVTVSEGDPSVSLNSVSFEEGDLYMALGKDYQLGLILNPSNALISEKMFISSDTNIVTVSQNGIVKANREGNAKIIATVNGRFQTAIDVYVSKDYSKSEIVLSPTTISFNNDNRKIKVGSSETLGYIITPNNADRSKLTWTSSDRNVVTVDSNGLVTAKAIGTATVSVSSMNGKRDDIVIEVYNDIIEVSDIILPSYNITMQNGTIEDITPIIIPSNASNLGLVYSSVDPSIVSVTVNSTGTTATLSALKNGTTDIIIKSGKVEKKLTVNVIGEDKKDEEDDPKLPTTIQVRSNKNNLAKTYEEAKKIPVSGASTVTVSMSVGVGKIKYCFYKYGNSVCKPATEFYSNDSILIPSGGMYVLRIIKYDYSGNEIPSKSINYVDGVLNYYINTESTEMVKQYTVSGAYENNTLANLYPSLLNDKVIVSVKDTTRHLSICYTTGSTCTPSVRVNNSYTFALNSTGTWRIFVIEYNQNNTKIGNTEVYYAYVKDSNTYFNNDVLVSNVKVFNDPINGKYLSMDVEAKSNFNTSRFCYVVVNKNANGTCNLDLTSTSVSYHTGGTIIRPKEQMKTYYSTVTSTNKFNLKYYLDGLDELYKNSDTNKDVIFEFAVKGSNGFTLPIKIRVNMVNKIGNDSYWNSTFIK